MITSINEFKKYLEQSSLTDDNMYDRLNKGILNTPDKLEELEVKQETQENEEEAE